MNFKIRIKIFLAFLLVIFVSIVAIVINFFLLNSLSQQSDHIINVVDPAENAAFDLKNSFNVDIRAIEKYGNGLAELDETEKIVNASEAEVASDINKIESSDLGHQDQILSLKNVLSKDEIEDEKVFELKKSAKNNSAGQMMSPDLHQALISFDLVSNEVNKTIDEIINDFKQHKIEDVNEFKDFIHQSRLYITAAFTGSILISLLLAFIVSFTLSASIKKVRDAALNLSQGDLSQRVSISSKDEVGDLANAFNQMAESIEKSQDVLKKTDEELRVEKTNLDQKVAELEKFNELTVGRELKMIELKKEISVLEKKRG